VSYYLFINACATVLPQHCKFLIYYCKLIQYRQLFTRLFFCLSEATYQNITGRDLGTAGAKA